MSYKEARPTLSKKDCICAKCEKPIKANSSCIVDPREKKAYHTSCFKLKPEKS